MAERFYVATPKDKRLYSLGTAHSAKETFPLLLEELGTAVEFVLFGEETHAFLEDQYKDDENFEVVYYDSIPTEKQSLSDNISYAREEFLQIFNNFGGKVVNGVPKKT